MTESKRPQNPNPDYQDRDIRLRPLMLSMAVIGGVTAIVVISMYFLLKGYKRQDAKTYELVSPLATGRELPPAPRLQAVPRAELEAHRATEQRFIENYVWIDEQAGLARIPVERAMDVLVQQGLPVRTQENE